MRCAPAPFTHSARDAPPRGRLTGHSLPRGRHAWIASSASRWTPADLVYVAHRGEHPLLCLNPDGSLKGEIGAAHHRKSVAYDLRGPTPIPIATRYWMHGLHVDPWDNVWITDVSRHLVMKFNPSGELVLTLGVDGVSGCDALTSFSPLTCASGRREIFS